jgi:hypothetical protein
MNGWLFFASSLGAFIVFLGGLESSTIEALQRNATNTVPLPMSGNVTNSLYLSVDEHRFLHGGLEKITGTVTNISPEKFWNPEIFAILYNDEGQVITVVHKEPDWGSIQPE